MADYWDTHRPGIESPAEHAAAVAKSDSTTFADITRAVWVGTGGDLAVLTKGGETVTFANVPDGSLLPIRVSKVLETGTDAADIVRLW